MGNCTKGSNPLLSAIFFSGCSVARSSRLVWDQEVAGSNPATPTKQSSLQSKGDFLYNKKSELAPRFFIVQKIRCIEDAEGFLCNDTPLRITPVILPKSATSPMPKDFFVTENVITQNPPHQKCQRIFHNYPSIIKSHTKTVFFT